MNYKELVESKKYISDMSKEELFTYCDGLLKEVWNFETANRKLQEEIFLLRQNSQYLVKQQDELEEGINKAIEYIEQLTNDEESIELMDINSLVQEELLKILKGVDKE